MVAGYCQKCGQRLIGDPNFCPQCGERIQDVPDKSIEPPGGSTVDKSSEQATTENSRTISFSIKDGEHISETQHFNVDNISFLADVNGRPVTAAQILIAGSVILLAISPLFSSGDFFFRLVFGTIFGAGAAFSLEESYVKIGTVNDTHEIRESSVFGSNGDMESGEVRTIEDQFLEAVPDTISIQDEEDWFLYKIAYNYHFVPENIVSMQEGSDFNWFGKALGIFIILLAIYIFIEFHIGYMLLYIPMAIVVWFLIGPLGVRKGVKISTQGDEDKIFQMGSENAKKVIRNFQSRNGGEVWVEAENVAPRKKSVLFKVWKEWKIRRRED